MTGYQLDLILEHRFPRVSAQMGSACRSVILDGKTSYAAEKDNGLGKGTVSRYVTRIYAELDFCVGVANEG